MRRAAVVLAVISCLVATPALARPWVRLTSSTRGTVIWIDLGSLNGDQAIRSAWVRYNYPRAERDGVLIALELTSFQCQDRMSGTTSTVTYGAGDRVIASRTYSFPNWSPATPDSIGEAQLNFVCSYPIGTDWRLIEGLEVEE